MKRFLLVPIFVILATISYAHDIGDREISINSLALEKNTLNNMTHQCLRMIQKEATYQDLNVYLTYTYASKPPGLKTINYVTPYYNMVGNTLDRVKFRKCMAESFDEDVEHPESYIIIDQYK